MSETNRTWEFRRDLPELSLVREELGRYLQDKPIPENRKGRLVLCADEAASNIVRYAGDGPWPQPPSTFLMEASWDGTCLLVRFRDNGTPYDPTANPPVDLSTHIRSGKRSGLGLHILRASLDVLQYSYAGGWNEFTLGLKLA